MGSDMLRERETHNNRVKNLDKITKQSNTKVIKARPKYVATTSRKGFASVNTAT